MTHAPCTCGCEFAAIIHTADKHDYEVRCPRCGNSSGIFDARAKAAQAWRLRVEHEVFTTSE